MIRTRQPLMTPGPDVILATSGITSSRGARSLCVIVPTLPLRRPWPPNRLALLCWPRPTSW
eukprot:362295-Lingulodinium_polyedra.AAC.1